MTRRPAADDDADAPPIPRWRSVDETFETICATCRTIIVGAGGRRARDRTIPGHYRAGYRFDAALKANSDPDYAIRILLALTRALRATDPAAIRAATWQAAHLRTAARRTALARPGVQAAAQAPRAARPLGVDWVKKMAALPSTMSATDKAEALARRAASPIEAESIIRSARRRRARLAGST